MKRIHRVTAALLALLMLLCLAACGENSPEPEVTEPAALPTEAADSLSAFRAEMPEVIMAVADFGFPELTEEFGIMDYLLDEYPAWMGAHDFIGGIPRERIIQTCEFEDWGELLCFVPADPASIVSVTATRYSDAEPRQELGTEEIYRSEGGAPILLLTEIREDYRVCVTVTDPNGRSVSFRPYWDYPEDEAIVKFVVDFTPMSEKTAYENALDYGWAVPDDAFLTDHFWRSNWGYELELTYEPGQIYDGGAWICEDDGTGVYAATYQGNWRLEGAVLHLDLEHCHESGLRIQGDFPILVDPDGFGWLGIFCTEQGQALPWFEGMEYDELEPVSTDPEDAYDYAIAQGWRNPELRELTDTFWFSWVGYALELNEDAVPGDNGGDAAIYDVGVQGEYTACYHGTWSYEDGLLHLTLIPDNADGYFIDDSFPVLMQDGALWIGRNIHGGGLPHFYDDLLNDILEQPMG